MELVNVYSTGRTVDYQRYGDKDNQLIISSYTNTEMDPNADVVELTVYGESGEFLDYNPIISTFKVAQGNVNPVTGLYTKIELDPKADVNALGLTRGRINSQYNFLKPLFNSSNTSKYWIKEISPSGTEIKLGNQNLSNEQIRAGFSTFQAYVSTKNYYVDFYLNFGQNRLVIANNAILIEENGESYIAVKLYEPLTEDFEVKDTLWLCDKVADSVVYTIDTQIVDDAQAAQNALRGPNNRIKVRERIGQTTPYYSYSSLFSSNVSSSVQQLLSYYEDKAIEINVDYSDFSNFVHFSSATERVNNFVYKLGLIEQYNAEIADTTTFSSMSLSSLSIVSQSNALAQQSIDNIINKFDTYEYYLYFSSESFAWPKSNSTKPYQLYSVTSSQALNWLGGDTIIPTATTASILYSASLYDNRNADKLSNAVPQYLLEDPNNEPYLTFVDMIGQHFDNVWLYYKDLSNRYSSFNSPDLGLSKDMVADALRGFGFNLYTNTSVSDNLYYTLFGVNQDGSLLPPTGSEKITSYVTSSIDTLSPKQLDSEIYKRFYHNLAYLLKTKGTQRGVKALIACYGIPEEILTVNEFGGNQYTTGSGIYEFNNQKINYFTQSAELSDSVLSPYVTLQRYNTDNRLNSNDIEVAFSPSNVINNNFVSSSGYVNVNQLIGNPSHQYLDFYPDLKTVRENYFASYDYPHSVWEYIRIIKYYNNSLFKTVKDWVPSKANASTGITIKSHILERNKYARTEPSMSFDNNISESIDMISIAGSDPGAVQGSTEYTETVFTQYGNTTLTYTEDLAKYTGRLSGSFVQVTTGEAFDQSDYYTTPSGSLEVDRPSNYQNYFNINRSKRFFELDYGYNQNIPVNLGLVTKSINDSINNNFNTYNDPYSPYADIQDYNYATRAFTDARYYGSKTKSLTYNTYTRPVSGGYEGDSSYGLSAAIDRNSYKIGWVKNIPNKTLNFPDKTQVFLKYLVDSNSSVLDLSLNNTNLFEVQNIFKSGDKVKVSISDINKPSNQKTLDGLKTIYRGGFSFDPIFYREGSIFHKFRWTEPLLIESLPAGIKGHSLNWTSGTGGAESDEPTIIGKLFTGGSLSLNSPDFKWYKSYGAREGGTLVNITDGWPTVSQQNFKDTYPKLHQNDWTCFEVAVDKANNRGIIEDPAAITAPNAANFTHRVSHNPQVNSEYNSTIIRQDLANAFTLLSNRNPAFGFTIDDIPSYSRVGRYVSYAGTGKRTQDGASDSTRMNYKYYIGKDETSYALTNRDPRSNKDPRLIFNDRWVVDFEAGQLRFPMIPKERPCYVFDNLFNFNIYSSSVFDNQTRQEGPGFYRELSDVTNKGNNMYIVPRNGEYTIKGNFPVIFELYADAYVFNSAIDKFRKILFEGESSFYYNWYIPYEANDSEDPPYYADWLLGGNGDTDYWSDPRRVSAIFNTENLRSNAWAVLKLLSHSERGGSFIDRKPSDNELVDGAVDIANRRMIELGLTRRQPITFYWPASGRSWTRNLVVLPWMTTSLTLPVKLLRSGFTGKNYGIIDGSWSKALLAFNTHPYFVSLADGFTDTINSLVDSTYDDIRLRYPGFSFRFYGVIEKCSDINSATPNWEYVCSTKISQANSYGRKHIQLDYKNNFVNINQLGGHIYDDKGQNPVHAPGSNQHLTCICAFADDTQDRNENVKVTLNAGDALRFRFFLLDFDCFTNRYGKTFKIDIGKPDITGTVNAKLGYPEFSVTRALTLTNLPYENYIEPLPTPNFQITDNVQKFDVYEYVTTVSGSSIYSIDGNSIILSEEFERLATTGSTYEPEAPASDNYSPVIDEFNVKQGDLIRFGAFNDNRIKYYTVKNAGLDSSAISSTRATFSTRRTLFRNIPITETIIRVQLYPDNAKLAGLPNAESTRVYKFFEKLFKYNAFTSIFGLDYRFKITSTSRTVSGLGTPQNPTLGRVTGIEVINQSYPSSGGTINVRYLQVTVLGITPNTVGTIDPYNVTSPNPDPAQMVDVTFEAVPQNQLAIDNFNTIFPSDYRITLDTDTLDSADLTINGQQIAILRPKPDETSVILDFKKRQEGEVAQTVLIPQDANKQIQDSVGTIYENLNTSLTNQLQP